MRAAPRGELGTIRIGFTSSAAFNSFVTRTIRDYRAAFPRVGIRLLEDTTANLLARFQDRQIDAAFLRPTRGEAQGLKVVLLRAEPMLVALPSDHELAGMAAVPLRQLSKETFILYPRRNGSALYDAIMEACRKEGFTPRVGQEAPQMASTVTLVAAGIGISIVPASMAHLQAPGVTYRPVKGKVPRAEMSLAYQDEASPALTHAFRDLVLARGHERIGGEAAASTRQPVSS
ncbi:hypothetical protein J8J14_19705 [Roseomonas sp. SSH11]|uniref:LysR substrate-binding domain-containing protein n=1 Tax=Pararoseomonas baculiformis TaxID=2820812 RepID=A0ABS4AJ06_9PROT|nr:LysR substrate-binding domain-containing protein [Pararoseomonas baculiformis]MBP0447007.1 hypothetical protein [Pararoseomonas baculiformis]